MLSPGRCTCLHSHVVSICALKICKCIYFRQNIHKTYNLVCQCNVHMAVVSQYLSSSAAFFCAYLGSAVANIMSRVSTHVLHIIHQLIINTVTNYNLMHFSFSVWSSSLHLAFLSFSPHIPPLYHRVQ